MRIGIFGGSFDPIHQGHLILAEQCRDQLSLDQVWFVPCAQNPLKSKAAASSDRQRVEMIELAIAGHAAFRVSKLELERGGSSYTVDTLEAINQTQPNDELFLLMGDDALENFSQWRRPERICELAIPVVVNRPGSGEIDLTVVKQFCDATRYKAMLASQIRSPRIEISSSDVRERLSQGRSIRYLMPRSVERYVESQGLYSAP